MANNDNSKYAKLVPIMLCFFAMGFVDLVGIASNYVKPFGHENTCKNQGRNFVTSCYRCDFDICGFTRYF